MRCTYLKSNETKLISVGFKFTSLVYQQVYSLYLVVTSDL